MIRFKQYITCFKPIFSIIFLSLNYYKNLHSEVVMAELKVMQPAHRRIFWKSDVRTQGGRGYSTVNYIGSQNLKPHILTIVLTLVITYSWNFQ